MIKADTSLVDLLSDIAYQALEITCCMFRVFDDEFEEMDLEKNVPLNEMMISLITFKGAAEGALLLAVDESLYEAIALNMLGVDYVSKEDKSSALCEIANIIAGNMVPQFAKNGDICILNPPEMADEKHYKLFAGNRYEPANMRIYVDEGVADITVYIKNQEL